jgi:hypothetical protein
VIRKGRLIIGVPGLDRGVVLQYPRSVDPPKIYLAITAIYDGQLGRECSRT